MTPARGKWYKAGLVALAAVLLAAVSQIQGVMNRQRTDPRMGLMRHADLGTNAPPVLAFTTVALGGFRGLIANVLWIRANDLQQEGKYFEMVQLADWITKLEPHFTHVWLVQAWNMAYNISVKFTQPSDRWRWVQRGIELLRDDGLRFNPGEPLIYRELAWFFQHKMGQNLDDAHMYYKLAWAGQMTDLLGGARPDFESLLQPQSEAAREQVETLRRQYKMDPGTMKAVDDLYGPLDWRLPEAHAIYWAYLGMQHSRDKDLMPLRRVIYQSMQQATLQGRLKVVDLGDQRSVRLGPNLDLVAKASAAYEEMIRDEEQPHLKDAISRAHRNFLREVVYLLYTHNRLADAQRWFDIMREKYSDAVPAGAALDQWALQRVAGIIPSMSYRQAIAIIEGLLAQHYQNLALDEDDQAIAYEGMARRVYELYAARTETQEERLGLPRFNEMKRTVLDRLLDPQQGLPPQVAARLRTRLGLPAPAAPTQAPNNSSPATP